MIIGRLDKRIVLQKPNLIPDGAGGYKPATGKEKFVDVATVWAEFKKPNLQTVQATGTILSVLMREIGIRYRNDIRKGWQVKYGSKIFSVEHTYEYRKDTTILVCKELIK